MGIPQSRCCRSGTAPLRDAPLDEVELFFGKPASAYDRVQVGLFMRMYYGRLAASCDPDRIIEVEAKPSPYVKGLLVYLPLEVDAENEPSQPLGLMKRSTTARMDSHPELPQLMKEPQADIKGKPVIVGTVRMGFGHHRIAYSAVTWALEQGAQPYLLDILAVSSPEADSIVEMDKQYSKLSRLSSNIGGIVDEMWGRMTLQGTLNSLRSFCAFAEKMRPLMAGLPRDYPVIAAHPLIGQIAVACGFKTVINLVIDNFPQYFVLVPGAMNLVQSPSYYSKLLNMGVPANHLMYAGHWVSRDIAMFAEADCQHRMQRCQKKLPLRLLIAIGGAGAQRKYIEQFVLGMKPLFTAGRLKLFINSGDHGHIADSLTTLFNNHNMPFVLHNSQEALNDFLVNHQLERLSEPAEEPAVTIFNFSTHFAAFRATDLLIRAVDVLATKPSELAFFPVPKLHIRRVGGHESWSAVRSCELGDGTVECREVPQALEHLHLLAAEESPLFIQMNKSIIENTKAHIYEGSRVAVDYAKRQS
mmetsp:Transcript_23740/g.54828  ORF Transcript_23740/g.54828 Transcript_23740/m.54828 type:complete len:529 (+) Transcript_23740:21-1607(+)